VSRTIRKIPKECMFCSVHARCPRYGDPCDYDTYKNQLKTHSSEESKSAQKENNVQ